MGKVDFSKRSTVHEWMDEPITNRELFFQNLQNCKLNICMKKKSNEGSLERF